MDGCGCNLAFPWDLQSSCSLPYNNEHHEHGDDNHHVHREGCDHERICQGDQIDCLMPLSDGSFMLSHRHVNDGKSHEHGCFVKVGESQGRSGNCSKRFFDLFQYQCPHSNKNNNIDGVDIRNSTDTSLKKCFNPNLPEHLEMSHVPIPPKLQEEHVVIPIDNCGIEPKKLKKTIIDVLGICCPAEAPLIKMLLKPVPGVEEVSVNVAMKTVTVYHDPITVPPVRLGTNPLFLLLCKISLTGYNREMHQHTLVIIGQMQRYFRFFNFSSSSILL